MRRETLEIYDTLPIHEYRKLFLMETFMEITPFEPGIRPLPENDPQQGQVQQKQEYSDKRLEDTLLALQQLMQDEGIVGVRISTDPYAPDARTNNELIEFTRTTVLHKVGRISVIAYLAYEDIQFGEKSDILYRLRSQWVMNSIKLQA